MELRETFPNGNLISVICGLFGLLCYSPFYFILQASISQKEKNANLTTFHCVVALIFHFPFILSCTLELWSYAHKNQVWVWLCSTSGFTFADVTGEAADLPVDHLLVKLFDVKRLHGEGEASCQHGKHTHTSAHTSRTSEILDLDGKTICNLFCLANTQLWNVNAVQQLYSSIYSHKRIEYKFLACRYYLLIPLRGKNI